MKKILLAAGALMIGTLSAQAQCDPSAHDWGSATFGVSPDPQVGETFDQAYINIPYAEIVYVKCPTSAGDIVPGLGDFIMVDSVKLDSITIFNGLADVQLSNIGLNVTCNNSADSPDPCMFMPGGAYCGDIAGTPNTAGTFDVKIWVTIFFTFGTAQEYPYQFEGYQLIVNGPTSIATSTESFFNMDQNNPNPAGDFTQIAYSLPETSDLTLTVHNLLGETVMVRSLRGKRGQNVQRIETSELENGIYLYSLQYGNRKVTKKMVVQH